MQIQWMPVVANVKKQQKKNRTCAHTVCVVTPNLEV